MDRDGAVFSILKWLHIFLGAFIFDSSVCCFKQNLICEFVGLLEFILGR